jgi:hypothetical protein
MRQLHPTSVCVNRPLSNEILQRKLLYDLVEVMSVNYSRNKFIESIPGLNRRRRRVRGQRRRDQPRQVVACQKEVILRTLAEVLQLGHR